ncbi:MarR family winged helix-turn-helix transcriptional regulator [Halobacillus sp. Marseille-Q1614]|uniref:MarR family winged helix-turn-helix transcriptional regulator n=1 Tax=Halobacillus sp. Marseille-Q1614 TaxID=2709134 RepID=UPI00156F6A59|nr:MarR family transcriptional regulator [Halobacillus sp. Marseille-Q1614]
MKHDLESLVGYNIGTISHFIQNEYNQRLSDYGVTRSQAKVIYFLAVHGPQSQKDLQKRLYIKASSMNGIIESLIKNECITKESSPNDRRAKVIQLTKKGKHIEKEVWSIVLEIEEEIGEGFSKEEHQVIISFLQRIQKNIRP